MGLLQTKPKLLLDLLIFVVLLFMSCSNDIEPVLTWKDSTQANLRFDIRLNPDMYRLSNFGEPPQMALWLENEGGSEIRTLWVSNRLAKGLWVGKVVCPTALPYWISRRNKETGGTLPSYLKPLPDGITGATPRKKISIFAQVPTGAEWRYFLELNVAGDFNETFPANLANGEPDRDGNGQPSLVYSGRIAVDTRSLGLPAIIGRTEQIQTRLQLNPDLQGITTAAKILDNMNLTYLPHTDTVLTQTIGAH